jgi:hypothetical protein
VGQSIPASAYSQGDLKKMWNIRKRNEYLCEIVDMNEVVFSSDPEKAQNFYDFFFALEIAVEWDAVVVAKIARHPSEEKKPPRSAKPTRGFSEEGDA